MTTEQSLYTSIGKALPDTVESQMFGKPCFKTGGKAFIAFFENSIVFKLSGDQHKAALALEGSKRFDPSGKGRAMKEWVQVTEAHTAIWPQLAAAALSYVNSQS